MTKKKSKGRVQPTEYDIEGFRATSRAVGYIVHRAEMLHERCKGYIGYGSGSAGAMEKLHFHLLQAQSLIDAETERYTATRERAK